MWLNCWDLCKTVYGLSPFPHTTILQQTTLMNIFCNKIENFYNWMDNLWLKGENIVSKGEIARSEQFLLLSLCFSKSCPLQRCQKASIWGKGLTVKSRCCCLDMWEELKLLFHSITFFNPFPHTEAFWCLYSRGILCQKERLLTLSIFLFCSNVF